MKTNSSNRKPLDPISEISKVAPSVAIEITWSHDLDARFSEVAHCCEGDSSDWQAWESEVRASAIVDGHMLTGGAYLAGTWEHYGDHPSKSNPDISGYLPQMIEEALVELHESCAKNFRLHIELSAALKVIRDELNRQYKEQFPPCEKKAV